jgi:hypothetical protein
VVALEGNQMIGNPCSVILTMSGAKMAADFEDELPHFCATFDVLKTEGIVLSI